MLLGLVSNCWRVQLEAGVPLEDLIDAAHRHGYDVIELRQTCLGRFESADAHIPDARALAGLPERFPGMRFNAAVSVPFLDRKMTSAHPVFAAGKWAAQAVAGESPPHLRLVDLRTTAENLQPVWLSRICDSLVRLTAAMTELDGFLSVEHSIQPWNPFYEVFQETRQRLGTDADRLRLCFDACNLLLPGDDVDPAEVVKSLSAEEISMVHFKQRRDGRIIETVAFGDINWPAQAAALARMRYTDPGLFEISPHEDVWNSLDESREFLRQSGLLDTDYPN